MSDEAPTRSKIPWTRLIAESLAIILSILAALAIDAWWEARKIDVRRVELIRALRADFSTTRDLLAASIQSGGHLLVRSQAFVAAITDPSDLPGDSLRTLAEGVFPGIGFSPAVANYQAAITTGDISLIESDSLLVFLNRFDQGLADYEQHNVLSGEIFYWGPTQDLRLEFGGVRRFLSLPAEEFQSRMHDRTVLAAAEAHTIVQENLLRSLSAMDEAANQVLGELDRLLPEGGG